MNCRIIVLVFIKLVQRSSINDFYLVRMKNIPVRSIQSQQSNQNSFDGFKIRSLETVLDGKDMRQDLHRHDFYFILVVRQGKGIHEIDFVEYQIAEHTIFMMRPGQVHRLELSGSSKGYLVEFNNKFQLLSQAKGADLLRKAASRNFCSLKEDRFDKLRSILDAMLDEFTTKEEGYENAIKAGLELFFIQLLRDRQHKDEKQINFNSANLYRQEKLEEFLSLLELNIHLTKQVGAYADMLNLSLFQLNATTKNLLGKTAAELIEDQIILEAKRFLLATSNQVNQIADHLGYDDVSYFIRFFKKHTGQSPEAFRQNFR